MLIRFSHRPLLQATRPYKGVRHIFLPEAPKHEYKPETPPKYVTKVPRPGPKDSYRVPRTFTIATAPSVTKAQALEAFQDTIHLELRDLDYHRDHTDPLFHRSALRCYPGDKGIKQVYPAHNGAVILVTRSLASWVEDHEFIRELLKIHARQYRFNQTFRILGEIEEPYPGSEVDDFGRYLLPPPQNYTVLTAAVDSIPLQTPFRHRGLGSGFSTEGISVIFGKKSQLVPNVWEDAAASPQNDLDAHAGLTFRVNKFTTWRSTGAAGVEVTVPVASTIFSNGRSSTMFATRWAGATWADYRPVEMADVTGTKIKPLGWKERNKLQDSRVVIPAVPITKPREIKTGLGNIIRQVIVDKHAAGASEELEEVIPKLLQAREKAGLPPIKGAIGVWALVIPPHVMEDGTLVNQMNVGLPGYQISDTFRPLLEAGCRIHRVLSGGGGWGDKKGLLSLDPETKFSTTEDEDVDNFARSFLGQQSTSDQQESMVQPSDFVAFFVSADTSPLPRTPQQVDRDTIEWFAFCVDNPESEDAPPKKPPLQLTEKEKKAVVFLNYFGAASRKCLFIGPEKVEKEEKGHIYPRGKNKHDEVEDGEVTKPRSRLTWMKIDTPGSGVHVT